MIRLRFLGSADVLGDDGRQIGPIARGPKRLALLAHLTVARPRGPQRRAVLIGLLWPELDETRARGTLRQTLFVLRRHLGDDVLVSGGPETLSVNGLRVRCDALQFEAALDGGRPAEALEGYGGAFLAGVQPPGVARDFELWLDAQRRRFADRAAEAARILARRAAREGDLETAEARWRQALVLSPYDESALRDLLGVLERRGDRGRALQTFRLFADRLATDLDVEPSAPTVRAVERIRGLPPP